MRKIPNHCLPPTIVTTPHDAFERLFRGGASTLPSILERFCTGKASSTISAPWICATIPTNRTIAKTTCSPRRFHDLIEPHIPQSSWRRQPNKIKNPNPHETNKRPSYGTFQKQLTSRAQSNLSLLQGSAPPTAQRNLPTLLVVVNLFCWWLGLDTNVEIIFDNINKNILPFALV